MAIDIFIFSFGAIVGSFLNALIYRLPRNLDFVKARSACPHCGEMIPWYFNIPIASFLFLKGRCSKCGGKILWRYPFVELLGGLGAWHIITPFGDLLSTIILFFIYCAFLVHIFIDLEHKLLLDSVNIFILIGFLILVIPSHPWSEYVLGGVVGFAIPYAVTWAFYLIKGQIGLGGGDIKLYGILGIYLGASGVLENIFLSCFLGALVGGALMLFKIIDRKTPIPFGPFIILVAIGQIYFPKLIQFISVFSF